MNRLQSVLGKVALGLMLGWGVSSSSFAQDPIFTQFYQVPTYVNPAFAGTAPHYRATLAYRNQFPQIPQSYETALVAFDYNYDLYNSGFGGYLLHDRIDALTLSTTQVAAQYAYQLRLGMGWRWQLGAQLGYVWQSQDYSRLTFGDQIASNTPTTAEQLDNTALSYWNVGTGMVIYNEKLFAGVAISRWLAREAAIADNIENVTPLVKLTAQLGGKIVFSDQPGRFEHLSPVLLYQRQGNFAALDAGLNYVYHNVMIGAWYRGLPTLTGEDSPKSQPAAAFVLGFRQDYWQIGYSYDYHFGEVQQLGGGAHEITLTISPPEDFRFKGRSRKSKKYVQCPSFYLGY